MGRLTLPELAQVLVIEESGEVNKILMKLCRFGDDSANPFEPEKGSKLEQLANEVGDLYGALDMLVDQLELNEAIVQMNRATKRSKAIKLNGEASREPVGGAA